MRSSYSNYYRRMLPALLSALEFRCNNTAYRPIMQALELLGRYADVDRKTRFYETVPIEGVVPKAWREAVVEQAVKDKVIRRWAPSTCSTCSRTPTSSLSSPTSYLRARR